MIMKYVVSLEEFLKYYYNNQYCYSLKTMDYISESALEYIL
jgi:hypothetical protein